VARKYTPAPADADLLTPLRALADPTRLRLFLALRRAERCVRDLVETEGIPQPLVSHHLRLLAQAGLVETRRADGFVFYAVSVDGMASALAVLSGVLDPAGVGPLARPGGNAACCT
jgi:DNA-binding transcriptional ArsR family regulator